MRPSDTEALPPLRPDVSQPSQSWTSCSAPNSSRDSFQSHGLKLQRSEHQMESSSVKRVTSTRIRSKRSPKLSTVTTSSPFSPHCPRKDRPAEHEVEDKYYEVKEIRRERKTKGKLQYLIRWEDSDNGEKYPDTWEPYSNVLPDVIADWQQKQNTRSKNTTPCKLGVASTPSSAIVDSTPLQNKKRKRPTYNSKSSSPNRPIAKKSLKTGSASTVAAQPVPEGSPEGQTAQQEIKDSYEEEQLSLQVKDVLRVEIALYPDFDRNAYAPVISLTQLSESSQVPPSTDYTSTYETSVGSPSWLRNSRPLTKEENNEGIIIPDSQELPGSSSYRLTQKSSASNSDDTNRSPEASRAPESGTATPKSKKGLSFSSTRAGSITRSHFGDSLSSLADSSYPSPESISGSSPSAIPTGSIESNEPEALNTKSSTDSSSHTFSTTVPEAGHREAEQRARLSGSNLPPDTSHLNRSQNSSIAYCVSPYGIQDSAFDQQEQLSKVQRTSGSTGSSQPEAITGQLLGFQTQLESSSHHDYGSGQVDELVDRFSDDVPEPSLQPSQDTQEASRHVLHSEPQELDIHSVAKSSPSRFTKIRSPSAVLVPEFTSSSISNFSSGHRATQIDSVDIPLASAAKHSILHNSVGEQLIVPSETNTQLSRLISGHSSSEAQHILPKEVDEIICSSHQSEIVIQSIESTNSIQHIRLRRPSPPSGSSVFPESYGNNYPPRPATSCGSDMNDQTGSQSTRADDISAQFKKARADAVAKKAIEHAALRASSSIPPSPAPVASVASQPVPLREVPVDAPLLPRSNTSVHSQVSQSPDSEEGLKIIPFGLNVFPVPLPLVTIVRSRYYDAIRGHQTLINDFLRDEAFDPDLADKIATLLEELDCLCNHQDLILDDVSTQGDQTHRIQARWAEDVSTKCMFLVELLEALRNYDFHVAIIVRPGQMFEIIESILLWYNYDYHRPQSPGNTSGEIRGQLRVSLLPTRLQVQDFEILPASLVIAFDSSFGAEPFLHALRGDSMSPLISLLVTESVEHLEQCFDKNMESLERQFRLVSCLSQLAGNVGIPKSGFSSPPDAAKEIASFIISGGQPYSWPIRPMPLIEGLDLNVEVLEDAETEVSRMSGPLSQPQSQQVSAPKHQPSFKRQLSQGVEDLSNDEQYKRQRLTPSPAHQATINENPINISDSSLHSPNDPVQSISSELAHSGATVESQAPHIGEKAFLLQRVSDLEALLRNAESRENETCQRNRKLEANLIDLEQTILKIQPKYQEALNDRGLFDYEKNEAKRVTENITQKHEARLAELASLKLQKAAVDSQLVDARLALSNSTNPEVAKFEKLREECEMAKIEIKRLQKRMSNMSEDLNYMRSNYQNASSSAAESAAALHEAQVEIKQLQEKASENTVRIHEIQTSNDISTYIARITQLHAEKTEMERELEKRGEELKSMMNGRRGVTRGTSVPRSPRMGSATMSPGPRDKPIGRVLINAAAGNRSRGNSPGPSELGGNNSAYRNALFGDALLPSASIGQGSAGRWGHLQ